MIGQLSKVGTTVAAINLDVSRQLNWGSGLVLELIVPDTTQLSNWRIVAALKKGFDLIKQSEVTEGSDVVFEVADLLGNLGPKLRLKDLYLRVDNIIYRVEKVPPVAPNEPQVFTITCRTRTIRQAGGFKEGKGK